MSIRKYRPLSVSAFTIVEILVVITILAVLSAVAMVSYVGMIGDARDTGRKTDMADMKVQLRGMKQRSGAYPVPNGFFSMTNGGTAIVKQGDTDSIESNGAVLRADPKTKLAYRYSTTENRQSYQIGMSLEATSDVPRAYVEGDFSPLAPDLVPSLILAMTGSSPVEIRAGIGSGSENRKTFVLNGSTLNVPYVFSEEQALSSAIDFDAIFVEPGVKLARTSSYFGCKEISDAGKSVGPGDYLVVDSVGNVTSTGCVMGTFVYSVSGSFGASASGATVAVCGSSVVADASGNFLKTGLIHGTACSGVAATLTGSTCTTSVDGPASLSSDVTNVAGSCSVNLYSVSGTFATSGSGTVTVSGCGGSSADADASGFFSFLSVPYGTVCNDITATSTGLTCSTSVNGPASLSSDVSGVAGSCAP